MPKYDHDGDCKRNIQFPFCPKRASARTKEFNGNTRPLYLVFILLIPVADVLLVKNNPRLSVFLIESQLKK